MQDHQIDPYRQWLEIPGDSPPNHYWLLGLPMYEQDPEKVELALMIQMAKVMRHAEGPHRLLASRICEELKDAAACLCEPHEKRVYDQSLQIEEIELAAAGGTPASAADSSPPPTSADFDPEADVLAALYVPGETTVDAGAVQAWQTPRRSPAKTASVQPSEPSRQDSEKPAAPAKNATASKADSGHGSQRVSLASVILPVVFKYTLATAAAACMVWLAVTQLPRLWTDPPVPIDVYVQQLRAPDPLSRITAAQGLREVGVDRTAVEQLVLVIKQDQVGAVRMAAVHALSRAGEDLAGSLPQLNQIRQGERDPQVRQALDFLINGAPK